MAHVSRHNSPDLNMMSVHSNPRTGACQSHEPAPSYAREHQILAENQWLLPSPHQTSSGDDTYTRCQNSRSPCTSFCISCIQTFWRIVRRRRLSRAVARFAPVPGALPACSSSLLISSTTWEHPPKYLKLYVFQLPDILLKERTLLADWLVLFTTCLRMSYTCLGFLSSESTRDTSVSHLLSRVSVS